MDPKLDYRDPKWVASRLGLDKNTVYRLLQDGTLPAVQVGKKWLISETRLAAYLEEQTHLQTTQRRMQLTPAAERVMAHAQEEALKYRHTYVGQEHILLALSFCGSPAIDVLSRFGADESKVRSLFESALAPGKAAPRRKPELTHRARRAVCLAAEEAQTAGRVTYGPEHLLIGLLRAKEGAGFRMLGALGVDLEATRAMTAADPSCGGLSEEVEDPERSE